MKIEIKTIVDVPDDLLIDELRLSSACQIVFEEITQYAVMKHFEDATEWFAKDQSQIGNKAIADNHTFWGKKCRDLEWEFNEVKE